MKYFIFTAVCLSVLFQGESGIAGNFDHSPYDSLLQKYVEKGMVNYKAIHKDQALLFTYLRQLEQIDPEEFGTWPGDEQKTFWINAYNAITIEGILRNYPIQPGGFFARMRFPRNSIRQIGGFWDTIFIKVMGKEISLDHIEHDILRKEFQDPRIHFVLVCASIGCPVLKNRAFTHEHIDEELEQATYDFINNPDKVRLDKERNELYLSSIFDWYREDFPASDEARETFQNYSNKKRGIVAFVTVYLPEDDRAYIISNRPKIKFLDYDWSLNEQH